MLSSTPNTRLAPWKKCEESCPAFHTTAQDSIIIYKDPLWYSRHHS